MVYAVKEGKEMNKRIITAMTAFLLITTAGCSKASSSSLYTATIEADSFYIMSEAGGRISEISIHQGDKVTEGETVLKLDKTLYEMQKKQADASLKKAQSVLNALSDKASDSAKEQAQAGVDQAQTGVDIAKLQLKRCDIASQAGGIVEDVYVNNGEVLSSGMNIAKIIDLSSKYMKIYVEESKRNKVRLGDSVPLYRGNEHIGNGTIIFISDESEFTPKNTETKSEKDKTVFEVKLSVDPGISAAPGSMVDAKLD